MKCLSIRQPWAWLILNYNGHDPKRIENRNWATTFRGDIWIHSGIKYDSSGADWVWKHFRIQCPKPDELCRGGLVGIVRLVDCVTESRSRWFFGPYGFVLEDCYAMPFYPMHGRLGIFEPKPEDIPGHGEDHRRRGRYLL